MQRKFTQSHHDINPRNVYYKAPTIELFSAFAQKTSLLPAFSHTRSMRRQLHRRPILISFRPSAHNGIQHNRVRPYSRRPFTGSDGCYRTVAESNLNYDHDWGNALDKG